MCGMNIMKGGCTVVWELYVSVVLRYEMVWAEDELFAVGRFEVG